MTQKFIVKRYVITSAQDMENDMNDLYNKGYYPKEIKLDNYQDKVDATIIYERDGDSHA